MNPELLLTELDGPRPLSSSFRRRLERAIVDGGSADPSEGSSLPADGMLLALVDRPRPMPVELRSRIEGSLVANVRPARWSVRFPRAVLGSAAAVAVLASLLLASREPEPASRTRSSIAAGLPTPGAEQAGPPTEPADDNRRVATRPGTRPHAVITGPGPAAQPVPGAPPPFAYRGQAPPARPAASLRGTLRIGVAGGDPAQEAGFRGYVTTLNQAGGIHGNPIEIVDKAARDSLVTVNLGNEAIATPAGSPDWVQGSLLETLSAPEDVLKGRVWAMSSPPERQAHLLASAVFPQQTPSAVAAIYRGTKSVFADLIPSALRTVLESRAVRVVEIEYEPGRLVPLVPADAVFLSLDQNATIAFLDYARSAGYLTTPKVACIFPMLDTKIIGRLGEGYLVLSPFSLGQADEARALVQASGRPLSSATVHGWVTAKSLAVALWRTGASTAQAATEAIRDLTGYDHGFAPAYARRRGSNARTPEGILYTVRNGGFVSQSGFATDPF